MNKSDWLNFIWNAKSLPPDKPAVSKNYQLRLADSDEEATVRTVTTAAFALDPAWTHFSKHITPLVEAHLEKIFDSKGVSDCVVLTHGQRIIGVSALDSSPDARHPLFTGPLILSEYRSRGLGTSLLQESLLVLKERGLETISGITPSSGVAARFVYTKFGSTSEPYSFDPS